MISNVFKFIANMMVKSDLQAGVNVLCKTLAHGSLGYNAINYTTWKNLQSRMSDNLLLGNNDISTWSGVSNALVKACNDCESYYGESEGLQAIKAIASKVKEIALKNEAIKKAVVCVGEKPYNPNEFYQLFRQSKSAFQFKNTLYPKRQRALTNQS